MLFKYLNNSDIMFNIQYYIKMEWRIYMEVVKNNKSIFIILGIIFIFLIVVLIGVKAFFPSGNAYGDRLKGIDKVSFSDKEIQKLEKEISSRDKIKKVSIDIKGRLINIILTVEKDADLGDMKDHCKDKLELFDEDELKYYDIQFYIINVSDKEEHFPAIGYKHKTSESIEWSNN